MKYDYITQSAGGVEYGIICGGQRIVFIKVGLGGDHFGHEDRYARIARRLHESCGCSVIVASNPYDNRSHTEDDKAIIEQFITEHGVAEPSFLFFGHSNGGIKGLELTASGLIFSKMILVNMPLMINFHKTKRYISAIPDTSILAVYGEMDPSYKYLPFIRDKFKNVEVRSINNADHNFKDMTDEFIALSDFLLEG